MVTLQPSHFRGSAHVCRVALVGLACLGASACSGIPIDDGETRHYVIVGFGVVSVPQSPAASSVHVSKVQALGLTVTDQLGLRLALGCASGVVAAIPPAVDDVRLEVSDRPFGPVTIRTNEHQEEPD